MARIHGLLLLAAAGLFAAPAHARTGLTGLRAGAEPFQLGLRASAAGLSGLPGAFVDESGTATPALSLPGTPVGAQPASDPVLLEPQEELASTPAALISSINLPALLNRHLKSNLQYTLGGATTWVSGVFDRDQNAFVSVLEDGKDPRFFNVKDLAMGSPQVIDIGTGKYKLSVSPDLSDQLESEVVLTNTANKKDQIRITLRELIAAIEAAGDSVALPGQTYHVFYYDDLEKGKQTKAKQTIVFLLTDAKGEFHIFLIPAEKVLAGKVSVFKMHNNRRVGLKRDGDLLQVYDNP